MNTMRHNTKEPLRFKCRIGCDATFQHSHNRSRHERMVHGNKRYTCENCDATYSRPDNLYQHIRTTQCAKISCGECSEIFKTKEELKNHAKVHGFTCDQCEQVFRRKYALKEHRRYEHGPEAIMCVCGECGVKCVNPTALKSHQHVKHNTQRGFGRKNLLQTAFKGYLRAYRYVNADMTDNTEECSPAKRPRKNETATTEEEPRLQSEMNSDAIRFLVDNKQQMRDDLLHTLDEGSVKFFITLKCLLYKEDLDGNRIESSPVFQSAPQRVTTESEISDALNTVYKYVLKALEEYQKEGSGWMFDAVIESDVHVGRYEPLSASGYMKLPEELSNKKAMINIKNNDDYCFIYCLLASMYPAKHHVDRVTNYSKYIKMTPTGPSVDEITLDGLQFPMKLSDIAKFEKLNENISVNVYGFTDEDDKVVIYPLRISNKQSDNVTNLLYMSDENSHSHYVLIKSLNRLLNTQTSSIRNRHYCPYCLHAYTRKDLLEDHMPYCSVHSAQRIKMPCKPKNTIMFKSEDKQLPMPYILVGDFECSIVKQDNGNDKHVANSFCLYKIDYTGKQIFEPTVYVGIDTPKVFVEKVQEESEWILAEQQRYRKFVRDNLTQEEIDIHNTSKTCHICNKSLKQEDKVHDHCHVSGEYRGAAHRDCNLRYRVPPKVPIFFHNLSNYDLKIIMDGIRHTAKNIKVLPENIEKYISVDVDHVRYLDSYRFLGASLDSLVEKIKETSAFTHTKSWLQKEGHGEYVDMLIKKQKYPYEFVQSVQTLEETINFPPKSAFYSRLTDSTISDDEYQQALHVYNTLGMQSFAEFHKLYLTLDVMLLSDVMTAFRERCLSDDGLDPVHFYTMPSYSFNAMLKSTGVTLQLLEDPTMYLLFENNIRGGVCTASLRYADANNPYLSNYDPAKPTTYIMYIDAVGLYSWAMKQKLPISDFRWMSDDEVATFDVMTIPEDSDTCYFIEVDLDYPDVLHKTHSQYPMAVEGMTVNDDMLSPFCKNLKETLQLGKSTRKLIPNLLPKKKYLCHYRNLQMYLKHGLVLTKVHRIITCKQTNWLENFVDSNAAKRKVATSTLDKDFYKLKINSTYGKCEESVRKYKRVEVVNRQKRVKKLVADPSYISHKIFFGDDDHTSLAAIHRKQTELKLNKPIYAGFAILELSKLLMFDHFYNHLLPKYGEKVQLCYTDTDSFIIKCQTDDIYKDMLEDIHLYDTADYPKDHFLYSPHNKKVPGTFSDEVAGRVISEVCAIRAKMYTIKLDDKSESKRAKGIPRRIVERDMRFNDYVTCLNTSEPTSTEYCTITSKNMQLYTTSTRKRALCNFDDKRYILDDGIHTLAYGHCDIK